MPISQRIRAVVNEIAGHTLADIGTDHGYIAIEAVADGRVRRALACDCNAGPLQRARDNVAARGLADRIVLRQGDGLAPVAAGEADCICIAGMGGMLIVDILRDGAAVAGRAESLVLQPQLDVPAVRRFVHGAGFRIVNERILYEGKFYTVLRCERGQDAAYTPAEYWFGKLLIDRRDERLKEYIAKRMRKCEEILRVCENSAIRDELDLCEEVWRCY